LFQEKDMQDIWSVWELMGATNGATRGEIKRRLDALDRRGWQLELNLAIVGSDGHWPANMAFWRVEDRAALTSWLDAGLADGLDETGLSWGKARLYQRASGQLNPEHKVFLAEYVVADDPRALAALGADLVLREVFAACQGLALWGAKDLRDAARNDWEGKGASGKKGIVQAGGWWAVIPHERPMV